MANLIERVEGAVEVGRAALRAMSRAGMLDAGYLIPTVRAALKQGSGVAMGISAGALRKPHETAIFDDAGTISYGALDRSILSIAAGLREAGVGAGSRVAILCRNHRGFVQATAATERLGAMSVLMNTGFAGPQLAQVLERESAGTIVYDEEFADVVEAGAGPRPRFLAWHDQPTERPSLDMLCTQYAPAPLPKPAKSGGFTLLTSGTTGLPKGAARESASTTTPESAIGVLESLPMRVGARTFVVSPSFHAWGLTHTLMAILFACPLVLQRRFDPEATLKAIEEHRVDSLVVVPVMMQRILELGPERCRAFDTSSLRGVYASGSALPGELALRWMDTFGDNLYNFYGSTEVAATSIAGPADLRAAPGTAGRAPRGTRVRVLDQAGRELPTGTTGRIFVANGAQFDGYTGGGGKEIIDGFMSIGDLGHFDAEGRLFVEGRDDDMIVSGGENVFPSEVEDLLSDHDAISEAAVIGVEDDEFGQRLKAFVVLRPGATLDEQAIKNHVKTNLARHKVPREVVFLDEIPRNATGKVLKRTLRDHGQA